MAIKNIEYFECPECDAIIYSPSRLKQLKHTKQGDPICPDCGSMGTVTCENSETKGK